uniref:G-protein coupled receptors family 1 profile domain-containing protein n=1 Tax=Panagrolaimus sp. PS1159 TaxID=55785 RepID=A0AC35FLE4_9BILA
MLSENIALLFDGPLTIGAALFALIGGIYSFKFLKNAGLNPDLTAALYILSFCDILLILTVVIYHSIEASSILLFHDNFMWNQQDTMPITHGAGSALNTASTLIVVIITFQRFFVVWWPLKYARLQERSAQRSDIPFQRCSNLYNIENNRKDDKKNLSPVVIFERKKSRTFTKSNLRPYAIPCFVILFSFAMNSIAFFEFKVTPCISWAHLTVSSHLEITILRESQTYKFLRTVLLMANTTIGPVCTISILTVATEYKIYTSLQARRKLFECQQRRRSVILLEELKEKVSRAVAIFIAVKFLIFRSLPIFFDIYETIYGIESFGTIMSVLVRVSDFAVVLNAATNSLAYFGRRQWLENRLKDRILRKHGVAEKSGNFERILAHQDSVTTNKSIVIRKSSPNTSHTNCL